MSERRWRQSAGFPLAIAVVVVMADQLTKGLIVRAIGSDNADHHREVIEPVLALRYVENSGAAFGVLRGQGGLLTVLAAVVLSGLIAYYWRYGAAVPIVGAAVGLLTGGAVGNVIDRLRLGYVIDFVAVGSWPTFNLADSAITVGIVLLAWWGIFGERPVASDATLAPRQHPAPKPTTERS
jgi:signal peptidase II